VAITHLRMASSSWFILSVWPLVWGWNPEETGRGAEGVAESLPKLERELRSAVRDYVRRDAMKSDYMLDQQVDGLAG